MTQALGTKTLNQCLVLKGISWSQMNVIETAFEDVGSVRLFYLDGVLQIMTNRQKHEDIKSTISLLLDAYLREKGIRFYRRGSSTLGSEEQKARKEPYESYNIGEKKAIPDLAIEVIFMSGGIEKLLFYKRIGVPEVWFWEDGVLSLYALKEEYKRVSQSVLLPELDIELFARYITDYDQYDAVTEFIKTQVNK